MTYREQLNKVNELGINICDLTIAKAIVELLRQGKTVGEITVMDKHVFIDRACWYL